MLLIPGSHWPLSESGKRRKKNNHIDLVFIKSLYLLKNLQCKLILQTQTSHCLCLLRKVPYVSEKYTEYFSMTQRAEVTYYKWIMRPNVVL